MSDDAAQTLRAFLAIEPDAAARDEAGQLARALREAPGGGSVRWVRPEAMHVTLRFLGEVPASRLPDVVERVGDELAGESPFRLALGALHGFPSPRRPRVVALSLEPAARVTALANAVERGVVAAGFEPEPRPHRPHLTLGRVKRGGLPSARGVPGAGAEFEVSEVVLLRSQLHPSGARYTELARIPLGGAARREVSNHPSEPSH